MSDALDEELVQRIDARGTSQWSGTCTRYTGAHRDPLSGEGARRFGGRWNPPLLFSAIYLTDSAQACMVEVERAAQVASTTPEKLLEASYRLHTIAVTDLAVLDLTTVEAREAVGLEDDDIYGNDWSACQAVGHAAWFLHVQGVLVPAAGGVGLVITAYEQRTRPGQLQVSHSEDRSDTRPLPRTAAPLILRAFRAVPTVRAVASIACSVAIRSEPADRLPPAEGRAPLPAAKFRLSRGRV